MQRSHYIIKLHEGGSLGVVKAFANIAFTAQRQCRTTAEALADIKNPKPYIQHNKAQYQQINNGASEPRAREEKSKQANELLEDKSDEWMDTGAPETAGRNDKKMETVGEQHRAED